jgi:hypothetical protein
VLPVDLLPEYFHGKHFYCKYHLNFILQNNMLGELLILPAEARWSWMKAVLD